MGDEERKVRAARRFTWIAFLIKLLFVFGPSVLILFARAPELRYLVPLVIGLVVVLGMHAWWIISYIRAVARPTNWVFDVVAAAVGLGMIWLGVVGTGIGFPFAGPAGVLLGNIVTGRRARVVAAWVAGAVVVSVVLVILVAPPLPMTPVAFNPVLVGLYLALYWTVDFERLWWLRAVINLNDSRRAAGELAVARERLRLADDLHDILGHALEVVAFKAELSGRLLDTATGHERARAEIEEVQRVARQSLREVRALVQERRPTDLATELAGARAVLDSAGIRLDLDGDPAALTATERDILGRVMREAVTNILRHSTARRCSVAIDRGPEGLRLLIRNDGVPGQPPNHTVGTGLAALHRYLAEHAGRLEAGPSRDGMFEVAALLPEATA